MRIKQVKPINFLFFRTETTIQELASLLYVGQELFKEAVHYDLAITGPVHWHYFGFTGDESKSFTLEIALPVSDFPLEYDGKFNLKRTEPFKCASAVHEGNWHEIPQTYGKLMQFITDEKLMPISATREVYINADFKNPDANVTEIQMGVM
jgi:effector-binding domain-containing protein